MARRISAARPRCSPACRSRPAGVSVNRFCSSGLQTIAMAANSIRSDGADCIVAGGVESISIPGGGSPKELIDPDLLKVAPDIYMTMIETAEIVAERYKISREYQDEYALQSQQRTAAAQAAGLYKDEIVPMATKMAQTNKETGEVTIVDDTVTKDECNRPQTTSLIFQAPAGVQGRPEGPGRQIHHRRQRLAVL